MHVGRYLLGSELGRGGAGVVYAATAPDGAAVAVKVLTAATLDDTARFERERRLQGALGLADGFVPLLDAGVERGRPFLVSALMTGGTLRSRLKARGRLGLDEALQVVRTVASAMATAHERGIVHRDLKPENILFDEAGRPFVSDLGLARHFRRDVSGASQSRSLSEAGLGAGTAGYAPLEQLGDARSAGPPADVFALGVMLYELLAGTRPFVEASALRLVDRMRAPAPPIGAVRPDAPPWLSAVIARALAALPEERFADAGALLRALDPPVAGGAARRRRRGHRGRRRALLLAAAVVLLLGVGALLLAREPAPQPPATVASQAGPLTTMAATLAPLPSEDDVRSQALRLQAAGDVAGALRLVDDALARRPASAALLGARGALRAAAGDLRAAVEDLTEALRLEPKLPGGRSERARALRRLKEFVGAKEDVEAALVADPRDAEAYVTRAAIRDHEGDTPGALADVEQALTIAPDLASAYDLRGLLRLSAGDERGALADLDRALERAPTARLHGLRGMLRSETDPAGALEDIARALEGAAPTAELLLHRGRARLGIGDAHGAVEDSTRSLELQPRQTGPYLVRAEARLALNDRAGAEADLDAAVALDPALADRPPVQALRAARRPGGSDAAAGMRARALLQEANERLRAGSHHAARAKVDEAFATGFVADGMLAFRAHLRSDMEDPHGALEDYEELVRLEPDSALYHALRAEHLWRVQRYDEGTAAVTRALELHPDLPQALVARGLLKAGVRDLAGAEADADRALALQPLLPGAYELRAICRAAVKDPAGAFEALERVLQLLPVPRIYALRGTMHVLQQRYAAAEADLTRALENVVRPNPKWHLQRGIARLGLSRDGDALADLTRALELGPDDARALLHRADAHLRLAEPAKAQADCDRAVQLDPSLASGEWVRRIRAGQPLAR